jgi:hypothetical protein
MPMLSIGQETVVPLLALFARLVLILLGIALEIATVAFAHAIAKDISVIKTSVARLIRAAPTHHYKLFHW